MINCGQDSLVYSITEAKSESIGANLFATMFCLSGTGSAARFGGNNAGGLAAGPQGQNGAGGSEFLGQEAHNQDAHNQEALDQEAQNRADKNGALDDDAVTDGVITPKLKSDTPVWSRGLKAVDEQPIWVVARTQTCGPDDNRVTSQTGCENSLVSLLGIGDDFGVQSVGTAAVKPTETLVAAPLPAGFVLLLGGVGTLAFWRRRRAT